jgi:tetratricopeptide (TPR) repeat protein
MSNTVPVKRRLPFVIALLVIATAVFAYRIVPYIPAYREHQFAAMSMEEQLRVQSEYVNDPRFLYYLGRKLNQRGQFATADPYLERAAGLDPDSVRIRDEWVKALMGHGRVSIAFGILRQFMASHPQSPGAPLLLGKFYLSREDWAPAGRALEAAVKLGPDSAEAWSLLAHVRIKMGQYGDAETALTRAIALAPDAADNHLQLAVLIGPKDVARARREYLLAVKLAPRDSVCLRQYGRFLLDNGDPTGAEREARAASTQNPGDMLAQLLLGRALAAQGRWAEAATPLEAAARLAPTDPQPAEQLRRVYRQATRPDLAALWDARYLALTRGQQERQRLLDATQAHPQDPKLHHQLAEALARIDDVNGCVREEAFAVKLTPDNPRALTAAARDLDMAGFSADALPLARQAAQQRLNPAAQETLANVLLHLGRLHEAAIRYEQIRDWKADRLAAFKRQLADATIRLSRSQEPAEQLMRAAQTDPDRAHAETLLDQALHIEPTNTRCLRSLLKLQFARQELSQVTQTANQLAALSPEDGVAHTYYVSARLILLGDGPLAESDYQDLNRHLQAAMIDPTVVPTVYYDRGVIEMKRGQADAAIKDLERARDLDPNAIATYHRLAEAKQLVGDTAGAQQAMAEFERRRKEQDLLARNKEITK